MIRLSNQVWALQLHTWRTQPVQAWIVVVLTWTSLGGIERWRHAAWLVVAVVVFLWLREIADED